MLLDDEELFQQIKNKSDFNVWVLKPSLTGWIAYSAIIPIMCTYGAIGNFISVLMVKEITQIKDSFFVYLKYLALVNFGSCITQAVSALSSGIFWEMQFVINIECFVCLPLNNMLTYLGSAISLTFIVDRYLLMRQVIRLTKPTFCGCKSANKVCLTIAIVIFICSIPFYFIYELDGNYSVKATEFYKSKTYRIYTWFMFITFSVLPAMLLTLAISLLTISLKKVIEMKSKCCQRMSKESLNKEEQHKKLVTSLLTIVFLFMIGVVPSQAASRYMAASLLFCGDTEMTKRSKPLEIFRILTSILCAINVSSNFPLFCNFCPQFADIVKYKMEKYKKWPCRRRKPCGNIRCLEEGFCNCAFIVQSLSRILVVSTVTTSFSVVKLTPIFTEF